MKIFLLVFPFFLFATDMNIPTVYTSNVGVLFFATLSAFSIMWGFIKGLKIFFRNA